MTSHDHTTPTYIPANYPESNDEGIEVFGLLCKLKNGRLLPVRERAGGNRIDFIFAKEGLVR